MLSPRMFSFMSNKHDTQIWKLSIAFGISSSFTMVPFQTLGHRINIPKAESVPRFYDCKTHTTFTNCRLTITRTTMTTTAATATPDIDTMYEALPRSVAVLRTRCPPFDCFRCASTAVSIHNSSALYSSNA